LLVSAQQQRLKRCCLRQEKNRRVPRSLSHSRKIVEYILWGTFYGCAHIDYPRRIARAQRPGKMLYGCINEESLVHIIHTLPLALNTDGVVITPCSAGVCFRHVPLTQEISLNPCLEWLVSRNMEVCDDHVSHQYVLRWNISMVRW
jgi:hypothetical protein